MILPHPNGPQPTMGAPYSAGSWVINDGSTINENPPTGSVRTYSTGDFTTDNLGDPNLSNGLFTATTHYKSHAAGSFLSSDPTATGDLTNSQRSPVPAGYYVAIDPTSTGSSQDTAATAYQVGQTISTEQDLSGAPPAKAVSLSTLIKLIRTFSGNECHGATPDRPRLLGSDFATGRIYHHTTFNEQTQPHPGKESNL